jgi:hypothetical protein
LRFTLLAGAMLAAGCRTVPDVAKYFDRDTPMSALLGFVYAIETRNWAYAYESLTRATQEKITPGQLHLAVLLAKDPTFEIPIRRIITEAIRLRDPPEFPAPEFATIEVWYVGRAARGILTRMKIVVWLRREATSEGDRRWRIDLLTTLSELYQPTPQLAAKSWFEPPPLVPIIPIMMSCG